MDTFLNDIAKIQEFHALGKAAGSALNDGMVERLASTAAGGLELLDRLNDPDTKAAVHRLIDGVTSLHASGGMDTLFEMATVVHAVRSAASDEMVERLYERLGRPIRCPHGYPIDPDHELRENPTLKPLSRIASGANAIIVRVAEHDAALLHWCRCDRWFPRRNGG